MPEPIRVPIVAGYRTPFCRVGTALKEVPAAELARAVLSELILRTGIDPAEIGHVILGNCGNPADAANVSRVAAIQAGIPKEVPAFTVHRNCASGMDAATLAAETIRSGRADVVLAGGTESMSFYPLLYPKEFSDFLDRLNRAKSPFAKLKQALKFRPRMLKPEIGLLMGLTDPNCGQIMGMTAENLAREFHISREQQDRFALESHQRALSAEAAGKFNDERIEIYPCPSFNPATKDVGPREGQSMEALAKLSPYFDRKYGTVTVGNSCQITDGGVSLLLMSEEKMKSLGMKPLGYLRGYAQAGLEPSRMGLGPVHAVPPALEQAGIPFSEIGRIEINEAFAAQVLACRKAFESKKFAREELGRPEPVGPLDPDITNVNGGAIALGHPVGTTGARLILTLLHEMRRSQSEWGLATLCVGGGQGAACVLSLS